MTSSKMHLQFSNNDTDEDEGLSDAGIETFKGVPYSSVARESGQNSRDAVLNFPVRMEFDVVEISGSDFPDLSELLKAVDACAERAKERDELKEKQFFAKAQKVLRGDTLYGLKISDEGTTGLIGPCSPGRPFHSLVKASGVSKKNDPTSGGSYGIGKKAAYAVSDLHTVFYATIYEDDGKQVYLSQGKCTLVSHERGKDKLRATGYWGKPNYLPIDDVSQAPVWLQRDKIGTTTISVGFSAEPLWSYKITESLVRNFFAAIHRGELEFFIDNHSIVLDKSSLSSVLEDLQVASAAEAQGTAEELEFSKQLYRCLVDPQTKIFTIEIPEVGSFVLHLLVQDHMPKRVAIIRNGMIITDNLQRFGDKLAHFPMYKDFVAIVEPTDVKGKTILKRLENPEHNDLSADRLIDEQEQKSVRKGMNVLKKWIRDSIRSEAFVSSKEEVTLEEMNEFFGDVSNADRIPSEGDGDTHPLAITYKPSKLRRQPPAEGSFGDDDDGGGSTERNDSEGGDSGGSGGGAGDGTGGHSGELLTFEDFRNIRDPQSPATTRILFFTPTVSESARVKIVATGMNNNVPIPGVSVLDDSGVQVTNVDLKAGVRHKLTVCLPVEYQGPINMQLHKLSGGKNEAA